MGDDPNKCNFCGAPFLEEFAEGWGSRYACGSTVEFVDGLGLTWTREDGCEGHQMYPGCWRSCRLYRGALGWQHASGCPNDGLRLNEEHEWEVDS